MLSEQAKKHLLEINGINTSPPLVAVVQMNETTGVTVLTFNNQILESGEQADYHDKKFLVAFAVLDKGKVPEQEDRSVILGRIPTEAFDPKIGEVVRTFEVLYGKKPGRTVVGADVRLAIGGIDIEQESFYRGMGSYVDCKGELFRRFTFMVPNTVLGSKPAKPGKRNSPEL